VNRKTWVLAAATVLVAVLTIAGVVVTSAAKPASAAAPQEPQVSSALVQRRTLSATVPQNGILTYQAQADGSPYAVINQARGIYTGLPTLGQVIHQGHTLYRIDDAPVVLLYGQTPAYRKLSTGASGPDVAELNRDLVALGYVSRAQLSPTSTSFGSTTAAAVEKLQAALGVAQTGSLALGQAVFEPTAVRVTSVSAQLGGVAQPGAAVLQGTSTTRQVQVALGTSQQTDVAVGDRVSITLPDNQTTPGVVSSVGTVATCPSGAGGSGSGTAAPGTDTCSSSSSGSSSPTINVDVTPSDPAATGTWDQAPVQVGITTASVRDALVVPVTALLAQAAGGYAVEVLGTGSANHLVPVSLGLFDDADGLVSVTGSGLAAGQEVVVPGT
jgi:hypothetical protein